MYVLAMACGGLNRTEQEMQQRDLTIMKHQCTEIYTKIRYIRVISFDRNYK